MLITATLAKTSRRVFSKYAPRSRLEQPLMYINVRDNMVQHIEHDDAEQKKLTDKQIPQRFLNLLNP